MNAYLPTGHAVRHSPQALLRPSLGMKALRMRLQRR